MTIKSSTHTNRLSHEKSPYLLQHAHNPVDWYPWSKEAFEKARKEEKPIFLSIGYSTCHWCHVMEEESFVNPDIAQILNESFVSIKVDREERPDVDHIYMQAVTAMTGSGGWPMSIFLTPDLKPFYGGTYFPPMDKWGRPGLITVLNAIREKWKTERDHIIHAGNELSLALSEQANRERPNRSVEKETEDVAFQELQSDFDSEFGGFGSAPKFPRTHILSFLLRYSKRSQNEKTLQMVERTLGRMSAGGINDHLAGGFHRYSTDRVWHIPHFEKMLYDQAMISRTYLEAFQATRKESAAKEARRIFDYVSNNLTDSNGAFYSAEDADSVPPENPTAKKVEGAFYVWTFDEITRLLGGAAEIFCEYFGVRPDGNAAEDPHGEFKGKNILLAAQTAQELAARFNKPASEIEKILNESVSILLKERSKRSKPHLDDKILTDWNGLMISSLAYGARVLNSAHYAERASKAADFILKHLKRSDGRLMHRYRNGETAIPGFLEDYAFLIYGLLDLYETTFHARYLKEAHFLAEEMIRLFWDESKGGFFLVGKDGETLIAPSKELYDGAIPSGNSVATLDLLRLGRMTGEQKFEEIARRNFQVFSTELLQYPSGFSQMMIAFDFSTGPVREIVIHGKPNDPRTQAMIREVSDRFLPNAVILLDPHEGEDSKLIRELAPFVKAQTAQAHSTVVFVCKNYSCELPVTEPGKLVELLQD